jgi:hypothetical protein
MVTVKLSSYTVGVNTHGGIMLYDDRQNVYLWGRYKREDGVDDFRLDKIISNVGTSPVVDYSSTTLPMFLRIRCDGTTKYYDLSIDGSSWIQVYSSTELTGMYVGMFAKRWGSGGSRAAIEAPFDNFKLRLYTPSEPSTSFSVEQTVIDNVEADGPYDVGETITVAWTNYDNFGAGENYINVEYYDQYLSQSLTIHSLSTTSESDSYGPIGNALGGHTIAVYVYTASGSTYDHNSAITKGDPWPETCTVNAGVSEFPLGAALLLLLASVSYFIIHRRYALNQNT